MKKFEVEKKPEVVGEKIKKALTNSIEGRVKANTVCKGSKR